LLVQQLPSSYFIWVILVIAFTTSQSISWSNKLTRNVERLFPDSSTKYYSGFKSKDSGSWLFGLLVLVFFKVLLKNLLLKYNFLEYELVNSKNARVIDRKNEKILSAHMLHI
jgi:hypothetical protein